MAVYSYNPKIIGKFKDYLLNIRRLSKGTTNTYVPEIKHFFLFLSQDMMVQRFDPSSKDYGVAVSLYEEAKSDRKKASFQYAHQYWLEFIDYSKPAEIHVPRPVAPKKAAKQKPRPGSNHLAELRLCLQNALTILEGM